MRFEFSNYFNLFPNSTTEVLNISLKNTIGVHSINIYDVLGQIVISVPDAKSVSKIDFSKLKAGTYFIKVNTDKGSASGKFIKN